MNQDVSKSTNFLRADELLVSRGLADTRTQAQALILARDVRIGRDDVIDKPSRKVRTDAEIYISSRPRFVSRGGDKLDGYLRAFNIDVSHCRCLDIGASTGGFTDCLLQSGASEVTCIDVGHGQLHYKLQTDKRVHNFENTHVKNLSIEFFDGKLFDVVVCDVSFISLKYVLPIIWTFVIPGGILIALIKPQFEADKAYISRCKGVIRDKYKQESIRDDIISFALSKLSLSSLIGVIDSPILGTEGNREFLFGIKKIQNTTEKNNNIHRHP